MKTDRSLTVARRIWTAETDASNFVPADLSEEQRRDLLREQARTSRAYSEHLALVQGEILYEIFARGFYKDWDFGSFKEYVETELEFKARKASYLVSIYSKFIVELGADPQDIINIPWSVLKELLPIINAENMDRLIEYAADHRMNDVRLLVKKEKGSDDAVVPDKRVNFVFTEDQKDNIDRALAVAALATGSDKRSYLMDVIATEYNVSNIAQNPDSAELLQTIENHIDTLRRVYGVKLKVEGMEDVVPSFSEDEE